MRKNNTMLEMSTNQKQSSIEAITWWKRHYCLTAALVALLFSAVIEPAMAAKTEGRVKVLGIRVTFADYDNAPSLETISNKLAIAERNFDRFSYNVLRISYDTVSVTLPNNRGTYTASELANAAENKAKNQGFDEVGYHVIAFFHGGHSSGNKAIVNGKRIWLSTGGAIMHEMGHVFNFGHQNRFAPNGQNPLVGELKDPDHWHFMKNGGTDPEPYEKWQRNWITDIYRVQSDGSHTKRLYSFDDPDIDPSLTKRALRVRRTTDTSTDLWIGFRSRLLDYISSAGKNRHLRQGLAFYWDRGDVGGQSSVLLDMHPGTGGFEDHALQPGETFANSGGGVFITNLGRGGSKPNEYIDVRVNRGEFADNQQPVPSWNAPTTWVAGEPLTITVTPNDPDGDEVACMWTSSDEDIPYNTSAITLTKNWNTPGSYWVDVVVSDMKGQTASMRQTVEVTDDPSPGIWAKEISGLDGASAAFEADPNGDGIANGVAFLFGAPNAMADATSLMPTHHYTPPSTTGGDEVSGKIVTVYRRRDAAAITVQSGVEFSSDLVVWNPVTPDLGGTTIEVDDDFFGSGIDRVRVCVPATILPGDTLFARLRVWQ
ncbi:MAG: hypothetical protein CMO61_14205 [Verrucomicrobiales bacterium]|nr:hypothetical protein [Verrucomicrobiales bacterium]